MGKSEGLGCIAVTVTLGNKVTKSDSSEHGKDEIEAHDLPRVGHEKLKYE